jgi:altronate hydrolase
MTGIVAGGANVLAFTTGRGSVFGCKPSPSIKITTNTPLYEHMKDDMDVDAGYISGGYSGGGSGTADIRVHAGSGEWQEDESELNGVGEEEFAPWAIGPTL